MESGAIARVWGTGSAEDAAAATSLRSMSRKLGIVGGGQLGRMLVCAAHALGIACVVLDPDAACPAAQVASDHVVGSITDAVALRELALRVDVMTVEIEHVDVDALEAAAAAAGVPVHPAPSTLRLIQDKLRQKSAMQSRGVPLGEFRGVDSEAELLSVAQVRAGSRDGVIARSRFCFAYHSRRYRIHRTLLCPHNSAPPRRLASRAWPRRGAARTTGAETMR